MIETENGIQDCKHEWKRDSGFYIHSKVAKELFFRREVQVEVCVKCGIIKLPDDIVPLEGYV